MRKLRTKKRCKGGNLAANSVTGEGTIITALEQVLEAAGDSMLDEVLLDTARDSFALLEERLSFTRMQSIVVAKLIDASGLVDTGSMASFLGIRNIRMLTYMNEIDDLVKRQVIRYREGDFDGGYIILDDALKAFLKNEAYVAKSYKGLSLQAFVDAANMYVEEYSSNDLNSRELEERLAGLIEDNRTLVLCKRMNGLECDEIVLFLYCLCKYVYEGDRNLIPHEYCRLFEKNQFSFLQRSIVNRTNRLFKNNLLGDALAQDFASREAISISEEIREYIDKELNISWEMEDDSYRRGLLNASDIKHKDLFYNKEERASIDKLADMLKQENFVGIQKRLKECGMRSGFACLFHGAPGTGKTETVLQLARSTGRDIMQVNVTHIKNKYVGESEKNIKAIFNRYRACCEKCEVKPILLFNEADAIINKRSTNVDRSTDKMENAIQNIILEEIEKLDGILIATTNLVANMDSAFERRFIYKVEFHKPDVATKQRIWQSMICGLDSNAANALASEFDLSGGQIENVTRKQFVDRVLYDEQPTLARLRDYCKQECLNGAVGGNRPRVGF